MQELKRIQSNQLKGLTRNHEDHRDRAEMHSTGALVNLLGDEQNPMMWMIEYKCEVCNQNILQWSAADRDAIRAALKENGIIPQ